MKKEYGKALRDYFVKQMGEKFSDFQPYAVKTIYLAPGEKAFYRELSNGIWQFVILSPNAQGHESFTIEMGWSNQQRFPEIGMRPNYDPRTGSQPSEQELILRLPHIYGGEEFWVIEDNANPFDFLGAGLKRQMQKITAEEARAKVNPLLDGALEKLSAVGLPYLNEYTQ
ncbi:hypothetical protein [Teredinibacter sp. KSP-S5-2]|uniref:hypothetical protein n=1 Tax=Teredinibacter sp. KSP-S5-2 TaxID=3034506 RepID=UPI0029350AE7|nr:hypothetical protein [Teredinibacter sp. KSP-S5-2]WNO11571.1 hypothetical protein P5V12_10350 [Teredinibacter sp. KSP-S5-2]